MMGLTNLNDVLRVLVNLNCGMGLTLIEVQCNDLHVETGIFTVHQKYN